MPDAARIEIHFLYVIDQIGDDFAVVHKKFLPGLRGQGVRAVGANLQNSAAGESRDRAAQFGRRRGGRIRRLGSRRRRNGLGRGRLSDR